MGKYIRKSKISGEVAVVEVSHQSMIGIRTRSRSLAASQDLNFEVRSHRSGATKGRGGLRTNSASQDSQSSMETSERYARETTPCGLIRDLETIQTQGLTTRSANCSAAARRILNPTHHNIPTSHEMDSFFAGVEQHQLQAFMEKYNFDPVNDHPLPGRYEWVQHNF